MAFSADNTNTNFGGLKRAGRFNVHSKVKHALQLEVIGLGCPAHIIHITARTALDMVPLDVEHLPVSVPVFRLHVLEVSELKMCPDFVSEIWSPYIK